MPGLIEGRKYAAASCRSAAASRIRWRATLISGFCTLASRSVVARSIGRTSVARIDGGVGGGGMISTSGLRSAGCRRAVSGRAAAAPLGRDSPGGGWFGCAQAAWAANHRIERAIPPAKAPALLLVPTFASCPERMHGPCIPRASHVDGPARCRRTGGVPSARTVRPGRAYHFLSFHRPQTLLDLTRMSPAPNIRGLTFSRAAYAGTEDDESHAALRLDVRRRSLPVDSRCNGDSMERMSRQAPDGAHPVPELERRLVEQREAMTSSRRLLAIAVLIGFCLSSSPVWLRPLAPRSSGRTGERSCQQVRKRPRVANLRILPGSPTRASSRHPSHSIVLSADADRFRPVLMRAWTLTRGLVATQGTSHPLRC